MPDRADLLRKVRGLLAHAARPENPAEAAAAAAKAQDLLYRHKLTVADVDASTFTERTLRFIQPHWRQVLVAVLAHGHFCRALAAPPLLFKVVGQADDVAVVLALYVYLSRTIARLSRTGWAAHVAALTDPVLGTHPSLAEDGAQARWVDSFRMGAVETLARRLERGARRGPVAGPGLIHIQGAALDAYVRAQYGEVRPMAEGELTVDLGGLTHGVIAGLGLPIAPDRRRLR